MQNLYLGKDYRIKLDEKAMNADAVRVNIHPATQGNLLDADIWLIVKVDSNFSLPMGDHKITLTPHDKSKTTVTLNVFLQSSQDIQAFGIRFLISGDPEETSTQ